MIATPRLSGKITAITKTKMPPATVLTPCVTTSNKVQNPQSTNPQPTVRVIGLYVLNVSVSFMTPPMPPCPRMLSNVKPTHYPISKQIDMQVTLALLDPVVFGRLEMA